MHRVLAEDSAAEKRMVPVSDDARTRVLAQVLAQPRLFGRACVATAKSRRIAIGVQRDDVPDAKIETVVTLSDRAGPRAPISKIVGRAGNSVLVIAERRVGAVLKSAPSRPIALVKLG